MFWADQLLKDRKGSEWINDAWTPSGIIHMGGLKGPVIHDVLFKILKAEGKKVRFTFGFDDMDPIDGLPQELKKSHEKYMGVPIFIAPAPSGKGSFGDYYGNMMRSLFKKLNIQAEIYLASDYYRKGIYNKAIEFVLDNAEKVRKVYSDMYKKPIAKDWFPLQVICPKCGRLGTTKVISWDGKEVSFVCKVDLVKWAKGCGFSGKTSPLNGNAKMPFKVEWAAKWWIFNVTVEGAGKDHASAGGTYDVARKICKEVFGKEPPLALPYEFFIYDGKKMSSSKGLGLTGESLLEVLPPQIVRFLMIKTPPNQAIEFNPNQTDIIPRLYDDYQKAAESNEDYLRRSYKFAQLKDGEKPPKVRFSALTQWVQMPNMQDRIQKEGLSQWAKYAKIWLDRYAPESVRFEIQKKIPKGVEKLSKNQKAFLKKVAEELNEKWEAEEFQIKLYEWAKELGISSNEAFQALYIPLVGKDHGPKAGWIILENKEFVKKRFEDIANIPEPLDRLTELRSTSTTRLEKSNIFHIDNKVKKKFSSVSIGVAIIRGVSIKKSNKKLEVERSKLLSSLEDLTTEALGNYPEVISYRKLYKEMGVDWHSRRPSPEALLRRVALNKGLYNINTCVDAYNMVVMKNRISVGAFDLDKIEFPTVLKFPKEREKILLLGDSEETKYKSSELAYFDQAGGFNIDFNFRDAQRTAVTNQTKNLYINVDGVYKISAEKVEEVLRQSCEEIIKYCGGKIEVFGIEKAS